jgi:hypothetical protein
MLVGREGELLQWLLSQTHVPPPQSLHMLLTLPCVQIPLPPQSLHRLLALPCVQILPPPYSLRSFVAVLSTRCTSPLRTPVPRVVGDGGGMKMRSINRWSAAAPTAAPARRGSVER